MLIILFNKNDNCYIGKFITARGRTFALPCYLKHTNKKNKYYKKLFEIHFPHHALGYNEIQINFIVAFWIVVFWMKFLICWRNLPK